MTGLTEQEFYAKYPTEESFMMEYGGNIPMYSTGSYSAKSAAAGKDIGKPGKNFAKIAKEAGERYGSEEAGERVAGAILAKLRAHREGGSITPTPTGDIFDMMGMSYVNAYENGSYTRGNKPGPYLSMTSTQTPLSQSFVQGLPLGSDVSSLTSGKYGIKGGMPIGAGKSTYLTGEAGIERGLSRDVATKTVNPYGQVSNFSMTPWEETTRPYGSIGLDLQNNRAGQFNKGFTIDQSTGGFGLSYGNNLVTPYAEVNPRLAVNFGGARRSNQPLTAAAGIDARIRPFYEGKTENSFNEANTGASSVMPYLGASGRLPGGLEFGAKGGYNIMAEKPAYQFSLTKKFQDGAEIDVKAPLYDETELNPSMNTDVYNMGGYYNMGGLLNGGLMSAYGMGGYSSNMAPARALVNKMGGYYAMGGNVPAYAFGDVVKKIGAGAYGVGEGLLDTVTMGATDQLTDMGYEGLQGLGGSEGKDNRTEDMIRGFGTTAGSGIGVAVNPASIGAAVAEGTEGLSKGISNAAPNSQGSQVLSQFLPMVGNIASMFGGQNAMGAPMKNGGMTPGYMNNMPIFAQGGMTMGNVEARELLIDPEQLAGGGVPKILTSYSSPNLPSHPKDGSIDDRGTVPLPEGKFIITQAENNKYKTAARSNDGLMANAITNNIQVRKNKKEAAEMQEASNAYNKFMSKYGGTIQKMYGCGGKTYGCGGSVGKYADGDFVNSLLPNWLTQAGQQSAGTGDFRMMGVPNGPVLNTPGIGSSLSQGWNLGTGTLPSGNTDFNMAMPNAEPRLNTPAMGSSLPQGWNLSKTPATVDASGMFDAYRQANPGRGTVLAPAAPVGYSSDMFMPSAIKDYNKQLQQEANPNPGFYGIPYASEYRGAKPGSTQPQNPSAPNKFGDYATMGMMFAPAAYNIGRGLFSKVTQVPKGLGMINPEITAPRMTDAKGRRDIREQMNLAKYNAGQLGGANVLPGYVALGTAGMKATSDYAENLRNKQAAMDYDAAMSRKKFELANAQQNATNWAMQQQMQAQKDNILAEGLGNLSTIGGELRREKVMGDVYKDLFANYDFVDGRWVPKTTTSK